MQTSRREAFRFWLKPGVISFGGPAGQIAIMHREVVEARRWVDERSFLQALVRIARHALADALAGSRAAPPSAAPSGPPAFPWRPLVAGVALWVLPLLAIAALAGPQSLYADVYRFFTTAALATFGGAYAVLAWVNQQVVEVYGWLTQAETIAGLALAETTPGPLIIVLQFIGFMTGWNHAGTAGAPATATVTSLLATWAIFLPSFVFILVGAPYVLRIAENRRLGAALAGVTAAVVGVIASLAVVFGRSVIFPAGLESPDWGLLAISALAFAALQWTRLDVLWVIGGGLVSGLILGFT